MEVTKERVVSFQTVANISLMVEFVVISAIVLTLLNAMTHGKHVAAVWRTGKGKPAPVQARAAAVPAGQSEAPPLRRAA